MLKRCNSDGTVDQARRVQQIMTQSSYAYIHESVDSARDFLGAPIQTSGDSIRNLDLSDSDSLDEYDLVSRDEFSGPSVSYLSC
jgi:hypothetical protein